MWKSASNVCQYQILYGSSPFRWGLETTKTLTRLPAAERPHEAKMQVPGLQRRLNVFQPRQAGQMPKDYLVRKFSSLIFMASKA